MKIVIDTNIIFSALLKSDSRFAMSIIANPEENDYFTAYFTIVELFKHKERIKKFSKLTEDAILEIFYELLKHIQFVNDDSISITSWKEAMRLYHDVDIKDVPSIALTIELDGQLWTSDEELRKGLLAKGFHQFYKLPN